MASPHTEKKGEPLDMKRFYQARRKKNMVVLLGLIAMALFVGAVGVLVRLGG